MAMTPRRIRQLPPALPPKATDVIPVSQMDPETGLPTTRAMSREQFQSDLVKVVDEARKDIVDTAQEEHAQLRARDSNLQEQINGKLSSVSWLAILDRPDAFPPAQHGHGISDITGLQQALSEKLSAVTWSTVTGKPTTFPPSAHGHAIADVSGLQAALDAKLSSVSWGNVQGKPTSFPAAAHGHSIAEITDLQTTLDGKEPKVQKAIVIYQGADVIWTYPAPFAQGVVPVIEALAVGPAASTAMLNVQVVGDPTNTSVKLRVNSIPAASIALLGLVNLNLFQQAPSGVKIHVTARNP